MRRWRMMERAAALSPVRAHQAVGSGGSSVSSRFIFT